MRYSARGRIKYKSFVGPLQEDRGVAGIIILKIKVIPLLNYLTTQRELMVEW
jgi:hypothetical protein